MDVDLARREVLGDFERHGVFVGDHAFFQCIGEIWQWIDIGSLTGQLMKHQLVNNPNAAHFIRSPSIPPRDRVYNLLTEIAPQAGNYGFHLLYMCIRDARDNLGHQDAAELLKKQGVDTLPPLTVGAHVPAAMPVPPQRITTPPVSTGESSVQFTSTTVENLGGRVKYKKKMTTSETYTVCEEGASGIADHHNRGFTTPVQETANDHVPVDDSVEKDAAPKSGGSLQYNMQVAEEKIKKRHAEIRCKVEGGAIADLQDGNSCGVEFIPKEDCADEKTLLMTLCKSVVASLNSRDLPLRPRAILVGATVGESEEKPSAIAGLPLLSRCDFESWLRKALERVVFCRLAGEDKPRRLTQQEVSALVKVERVKVAASQQSAQPHSKEELVYVALVTVLPDWQICQNRLYDCRFPDKNLKLSLQPQVYEYHRGSVMELKSASGISDLERQLKVKYDTIRHSSSRK